MEANFNLQKYNKAEFRLITSIFITAIISVLIVFTNENRWLSDMTSITSYQGGNTLLRFLRYSSLYIAYAATHFVIVKKLADSSAFSQTGNIIIAITLFTGVGIIWTLAEIWTQYSFYYFFRDFRYDIGSGFRLMARNFLKVLGITSIYLLYTYLKYDRVVLQIVNNINAPVKLILRDCYWAFIAWLVLAILIQGPAILLLPVIPVYAYLSVRLIPIVKDQQKAFVNYLTRVTLIALIISLIVLLVYGLMTSHASDKFAAVVLLYAAAHLFIIAPATWAIYHYRISKNAELTGLKTALGQSSASLDFLRSQINPHFLFNALNTLYGTAIQEHADRTGEGIQRLGDMMRFMLHENTQEQISLMREVDYLNNYIDLQKLRTHASPEITINAEIEESVNGLQIAPMLLIPFIENAFKHGISMREASHIKIGLHTEGHKLFFDVYNSVHTKAGIDPEKDNTGIGLENVKQRLQLLYPGKHELSIRETAKEFFIHLTLQL